MAILVVAVQYRPEGPCFLNGEHSQLFSDEVTRSDRFNAFHHLIQFLGYERSTFNLFVIEEECQILITGIL
jgi:hypothetical protein